MAVSIVLLAMLEEKQAITDEGNMATAGLARTVRARTLAIEARQTGLS